MHAQEPLWDSFPTLACLHLSHWQVVVVVGRERSKGLNRRAGELKGQRRVR